MVVELDADVFGGAEQLDLVWLVEVDGVAERDCYEGAGRADGLGGGGGGGEGVESGAVEDVDCAGESGVGWGLVRLGRCVCVGEDGCGLGCEQRGGEGCEEG